MEDRDEGEVEPDEREDSEEPAELGGLLEYEYSSDRREPAKRQLPRLASATAATGR